MGGDGSIAGAKRRAFGFKALRSKTAKGVAIPSQARAACPIPCLQGGREHAARVGADFALVKPCSLNVHMLWGAIGGRLVAESGGHESSRFQASCHMAKPLASGSRTGGGQQKSVWSAIDCLVGIDAST